MEMAGWFEALIGVGKPTASASMLTRCSKFFSANRARYKKTASAAGGVQHLERPETIEEGPKQRQPLAMRLGLRAR